MGFWGFCLKLPSWLPWWLNMSPVIMHHGALCHDEASTMIHLLSQASDLMLDHAPSPSLLYAMIAIDAKAFRRFERVN